MSLKWYSVHCLEDRCRLLGLSCLFETDVYVALGISHNGYLKLSSSLVSFFFFKTIFKVGQKSGED